MRYHFCSEFFIWYYVVRILGLVLLFLIGLNFTFVESIKSFFTAAAIISSISLVIQFIDFETNFRFVLGQEWKHSVLIYLTFIKFLLNQCIDTSKYISKPTIFGLVYNYKKVDSFGNVQLKERNQGKSSCCSCRWFVYYTYYQTLTNVISILQIFYLFARLLILVLDIGIYFKQKCGENQVELKTLRDYLEEQERIYNERNLDIEKNTNRVSEESEKRGLNDRKEITKAKEANEVDPIHGENNRNVIREDEDEKNRGNLNAGIRRHEEEENNEERKYAGLNARIRNEDKGPENLNISQSNEGKKNEIKTKFEVKATNAKNEEKILNPNPKS